MAAEAALGPERSLAFTLVPSAALAALCLMGKRRGRRHARFGRGTFRTPALVYRNLMAHALMSVL